jgi:hypothetical protein
MPLEYLNECSEKTPTCDFSPEGASRNRIKWTDIMAGRILRTFFLCALAGAAAACSPSTGPDDAIPAELRAQPYPRLIPLEQALAPLPAPQEQSADLDQELQARAARLRARAARLRNAAP